MQVLQTPLDIAEKYKTIKNAGVGSERLASKILPIRDFNNWAKMAVIQLCYNYQKSRDISVLDLCCGKGGDLNKYARLGSVSYYAGVDITLHSLIEAIKRYNQKLCELNKNRKFGQPFQADFTLADVMSAPLYKHFQKTKFDMVSCMFALHYAFQSKQTADAFFGNVKNLMAPNGSFVAVFPCKDTILKRLQEQGADLSQGNLILKNSLYSIKFPNAVNFKANLFGQKYIFDLDEAVGDTAEYLIDMRDFRELCSQNQLTIKHHFPNLETLLQTDQIPQKAKQNFSNMMKRTAKFIFLLNQNLNKGQKMTDDNFWDNIDEEQIDQINENQIQKITDLGQLPEEYLEVIRLYQAVMVVHTNPAEVKSCEKIRIPVPEARRAIDICNLTKEPINLETLREEFKGEMWEPSVWM
ncbi:MRNA_cap guanine-N7 methyltransferase [Hexamita inflata]|uniref:mRNA (guanine-N(7))-methyltransferase n=1 Tax=Hexamita inflata TaxID=28002 RepID=A0AA86TR78_9EUKA|nr:MRNA cap guanine-N7 methyltransferase [Hexamita inflata]